MKNIQHKKTERGSAILMTLGVLSIVMVIAMLFAATARNARTIAVAGADDVRASIISESAEAFALSMLQEMTQTSDTYRPGEGAGIKYKDDSTVTRHQPYIGNFSQDIAGLIGHATLTPPAASNYTQNAIVTKPTPPAAPTGYQVVGELDEDPADTGNKKYLDNRLWHVVEKQSRFGDEFTAFSTLNSSSIGFQNVTDADGEVIGRYGFVILADGSKFNLNAIVNPLVKGSVNHSIPAIEDKKVKVVTLTPTPAASSVTMPLGMSANPNGENDTGAFPIMGFTDKTSTTYGNTITEGATLRYGLHPQEIRVNDDYATPTGNAPRWNNFLQLREKGNFKDKDILLYSLYGGADEPEMVYDSDGATITYTNPLPGGSEEEKRILDLIVEKGKITSLDADEVIDDILDKDYIPDDLPDEEQDKIEKKIKELEKFNIQFPDLTGDGNTVLGWEGISAHFKGNDYIIDDGSDWSNKLFRKPSLLGGSGSIIEFKDDTGTNVNSHIMANMVDFCDKDNFATYLINKDAAINYSNLETTITQANIGTLKDNNNLICGNELAPAVIGVKLAVAIEGGKYANIFEDKGEPVTRYYTWKMTQRHTIKITPTISLANIYAQLNTPTNYKVKIAIKGEVTEEIEGLDNISPYEPGVEYDTGYRKTFSFFIPATEYTASVSCPIADPDPPCLSADILLDVLSTEIAETPGDFSTARAGTLANNAEIKYDCAITDVLIVLHPDGGDATVISDIAYFHFNSPDDDPDYDPEAASAKDTFSGPFASPIPISAVSSGSGTEIKAFNVVGESELWKGYAFAKDPRCNDRGDAWKSKYTYSEAGKEHYLCLIDSEAASDTLSNKAWESIETECKVTSGGDKDWEPDLEAESDGTITATFSTAFIANEPFTSLWQLGAIHRYEVGRTINLRKYNDNLTIGKYEDGDAALLDFFKVTEAENGILGKFNSNSFNEGAYKYLLKNMPFGDDATIYRPVKNCQTVEEVGDSVDTFVTFETSLSAEDIYKKQSWLPMQAFMHFCTPKEDGGSDREVEAFFGCTAGLLSTRYETFTIVTVGQSLQYLENLGKEEDDGGNLIGENFTKKEEVEELGGVNPVQINGKWYSTQGTCVQLVTVLRDCWLNTFKIVNRQRL